MARNQTVSRIVETLLHEATAQQHQQIISKFAEDWELVCTDRFASFVTQTLVSMVPQFILETTNESEDEEGTKTQSLSEIFSGLCVHFISHSHDYIQHTYASHVMRVLLETLAGVQVSDHVIRSRLSREQQSGAQQLQTYSPEIYHKFKATLKELKEKILKQASVDAAIFTGPLSVPVLQTLLLVYKKRDQKVCQSSCQVLLNCVKESQTCDFNTMVTSSSGSHLMEQLIQLMPGEVYQDFLESHFMKNLATWSCHPVANFVIQRIIGRLETEEQMSSVYRILKKEVENILACNHTGVLVKMVEAAVRLKTKQKKILQSLLKAFHCYTPVERQMKCVQLIASLTTYEVFYGSTEDADEDEKRESTEKSKSLPVLSEVNYQGSLLLQKLFNLDQPGLLVNSLLDAKPSELKFLSCDPSGSHIVEAFLRSVTVQENSKEMVYTKLKGLYTEIACSKNGSRTVDSLWSLASLKIKTVMAEELAKNEAKLQGDRFGKFVHRNCAIHLFMNRRSDWKSVQMGELKKRKLFQDILDETGEGPEKKKNKTKMNEGKVPISGNDMKESKLKSKNEKFERTPKFGKKGKRADKVKKNKDKKFKIKDKSMQKLLADMQPKRKKKTKLF